MEGSRYYTVSYDERNYSAVKRLRRACGGIVAYGRWEVLKQLLLDADGVLDIADANTAEFMADELELTIDELKQFIETCAELKLVDEELLHSQGHVVSHEIADLIAYKKQQSEYGKKGGRPQKATKKGTA